MEREFTEAATNSEPLTDVTLTARPERWLIRPGGSHRHISFRLRVRAQPSNGQNSRTPLTLALVLDRSGSMSGEKLATAKAAALAVLDRLDERDRTAIVVFDDRIDVIQPTAPVTKDLRDRVRSAFREIEARGTTALHEGWLTGAREIADEGSPHRGSSLSRVFLLTDGLANVGTTDPETIAAEAADIREQTGIGTSTFGIGGDYNEGLLGPLAAAGGGQFHHLRSSAEIAKTFVGELGDLLTVAAQLVRLELDVPAGVRVEVVSAYHTRRAEGEGYRHSVAIGDLLSGDERYVVVRFGFPPQGNSLGHRVRARVVWLERRGARETAWQEVEFSYADNSMCDAEQRDPAVMHWVGLHHAERAKLQATEQSRRGDQTGARDLLRKVARRITEYAGSDVDLQNAVAELLALEREVAIAPLASERRKEVLYESQRRSRAQKDYRDGES